MYRRIKLMVCCCSVLWLVGCSSTTFVYNRLDFLLPWYVDDYVDLTGQQKQQLDLWLEPFLAWHRQEELPQYILTLERVEASLDEPLSADDVAIAYSELELAWIRLQDQALIWLLQLGATLSDEQVAEFMQHLEEKQQEFEEKYLTRSDSEYHEESYDDFVDSMQDYLGRLSREQRDRLRAASEELKRFDALWLQERAAWLEELGTLLQREPGWQQRILDAIDGRQETLSPDYLQAYEYNLAVIFSAVADVLNSRTDRQDRRLRGKLGDLREDLQTLVEQGLAAPAAGNS